MGLLLLKPSTPSLQAQGGLVPSRESPGIIIVAPEGSIAISHGGTATFVTINCPVPNKGCIDRAYPVPSRTRCGLTLNAGVCQ